MLTGLRKPSYAFCRTELSSLHKAADFYDHGNIADRAAGNTMTDNQDPRSATALRARSLELPGVLMQALTHVAPAVGMIAFIPMITGYAGVASPFAYLVAFLIVLTLGVSLTQLAKHLPAAGGYYTYVSRTLHPRVGFLAAWAFFLVELLAPGAGFGFGGYILENTLKAEYGFTFHWWIFLLLATALVFVTSYFGIRIAVGLAVVLGVLEIAIVLALSIAALSSPGPGGVNLAPFNPANSVSSNGLFLAVVFTIFAFAGFESVAPLAEETRNPRRILPRAIMFSIAIAGAFYVFTGWAFLIGWGTDNVAGFVASPENPVFVLARQHWGGAWIIAFAALINSIFAIGIAASNAGTRVLFAMGRSGALPSFLAKVHPTHKTPVNAIYLQILITLVFGLGVGLGAGPLNFFFTVGLATTLCLMLMYIAGNIGVMRYYLTERRDEFRPVIHLAFPVVSSIALIVVGYKSLNPLPPSPTRWGAFAAAAWLLLGVVVLLAMRKFGRESWLLDASRVIVEEPADASATSAQPASPAESRPRRRPR